MSSAVEAWYWLIILTCIVFVLVNLLFSLISYWDDSPFKNTTKSELLQEEDDLECGPCGGSRSKNDSRSEKPIGSRVNRGNAIEGKHIFGQFKEPFNVQKCLGYLSNYLLDNVGFSAVEVEEFIDDLSKRWMFVDRDESGMCTVLDLRQAVWESDPECADRPLPDGPLPNAQQDIVDEILEGVKIGSRSAFTFWDLANHVHEDREVKDMCFPVPRQGWAYADFGCIVKIMTQYTQTEQSN